MKVRVHIRKSFCQGDRLVNRKIFLVGLAFLVLAGGLIVFYLVNRSEQPPNYITEMILREGDLEYKVLYDIEKKQTLLVTDETEEVLSILAREPQEVLRLPDTSESKNTIANKEKISPLTYENSFLESVQYLNYLKDQGYETIREVHTPYYQEKILQKENNKKRIVVFRNFMMIGDLNESAELPPLEKYLNKYK